MVSIFQSVLFHCSNKSLIAHAADKSQSLMQKERKKFFFFLFVVYFWFFASRPYLKVHALVGHLPHHPKVQGSIQAATAERETDIKAIKVYEYSTLFYLQGGGGRWAYFTHKHNKVCTNL